jgi:hypothetical protein
MWWAGLLVVIFLVFALRPPENRAVLHVVTLATIVAVLLVAFLRLPGIATVP